MRAQSMLVQHLRIGTGGGEITRLTWYQTIGQGQNPANITPNGAFTVGSGTVTIPVGSASPPHPTMSTKTTMRTLRMANPP